MNRPPLEQLTRAWRRAARRRAALVALGLAGFALIPVALHPTHFWLVLPLAVLLAPAFGYWRWVQDRGLTTAQIVRYLDRTHPELEESSLLWLRPAEKLTLLERLQLHRLNAAAARLADRLPPHARFGEPPRARQWPAVCFALAGVGSAAAVTLLIAHDYRASSTQRIRAFPTPRAVLSASAAPAAPVWPKIVAGRLTITPPAYTGHPPRQTTGFNAEPEENAVVTWDLALDRPVREAHLVFGPALADRLPLQPTSDQRLQATRPVADTTLYSLAATLPDGTPWTPPEIYSLKIIKDQPPVLRLVQPAAARAVVPSAAPSAAVEVTASDDYGVSEAHLIATVAKGSGEAVKFREQTLPFDADPSPANPPDARARRFTKTLDLAALGLEPGDELYFFVEALDNRPPAPNRTRTETRFLARQGPGDAAPAAGRGVGGVNLVPQYFRSERQLIIDTEKLIADRPTLPAAEFRARANDLGADQALLRLRYGQFLGEDQENDPVTDHAEVNLNPRRGSVPQHQPGPRAAASVAQRFRQEHIAQDREGGGDETRAAGLRPAPVVPLTADQIRRPYVDSHDSQDEATFFDHEARGTMRDALAAMWAAEGALRVAQPQDALAPEHRALDILKDLQQSARAYVQHVGFEAPPLKIDERRLKGDAAGVPLQSSAPATAPPTDSARAAVRDALAALSPAGPARTGTLRRVEPILTAAAARGPDDFLPGLQSLRRLLADGGTDATTDLPTLERALLRLLPPANPLPARAPDAVPPLAASYFRALQAGTAKP